MIFDRGTKKFDQNASFMIIGSVNYKRMKLMNPMISYLYKNAGVVCKTWTNYRQNLLSGFLTRKLAKLAHNGFDRK